MYPDSLNMYVYTDQEEHSDASSDIYTTAISSYATAEAIWMTFPFLEPWEGTVWTHTDKNRYYTGAQISQGEQNHIIALVLIFFRLDYDEEPQRIPVYIGLP